LARRGKRAARGRKRLRRRGEGTVRELRAGGRRWREEVGEKMIGRCERVKHERGRRWREEVGEKMIGRCERVKHERGRTNGSRHERGW
jgi:hypothetical protein